MEWLKQLNEAGVGAGVIVSFAALVVGYCYYRSNLRFQRKLNARQTYRRYLELAFEHPDLAEPNDKDFAAIPVNTEKYHQYEWFVFILLSACGEIIASLGKDFGGRWKATLLTQLGFHDKYFSENDWFKKNGRNQLDENVAKLIGELRGFREGGCDAQP
jgi:hypothetical protein